MLFIKSYNIFLNEAISISKYKEWVKWANKIFYKKVGNYFKKFEDHSTNFDRIYFDLTSIELCLTFVKHKAFIADRSVQMRNKQSGKIMFGV